MKKTPTKKFFATADAIVTLQDEKALKEYFAFSKTNKYVAAYNKEVSILGIPNEPLFFGNYKGEFAPDSRYPDVKVDGVSATDEDFQSCVVDRGLFAVMPVEGEIAVYPTIYTAFNGMCARAGIYGPLISNADESRSFTPLPAELKGQWLTTGFHHNKGGSKWKICDGFIDACNSDNYVWLSEKKGYDAVIREVKKDHPNVTYATGLVSHEYLYIEVALNDDLFLDGLKNMFLSYGVDVQSLTAGIYYCTSDVGNAAMSAYPFYTLNGTRFRLGKGVGIRHEGDACIAKFSKELKKLGMLFKEAEDMVEELGNTTITHPAGCLQQIIEKHKWIPRKSACKVLEEIGRAHV